MKILICPDKFRGSLTAAEATEAISSAVMEVYPDAEIRKMPLADGGEGSLEALTANGGEIVSVHSVDPLYRPIISRYGIIDKTAIIELSQVVGLHYLSAAERNPEFTSTYGLGVVIADAVRRGAEHLVLAIGGSATNDCGIGMLSALGWIFLDADDEDVEPVGASLSRIETIIPPSRDLGVEVTVLSDVDNLLFGENGAAFVYAPQKGADIAMCERLDYGLHHFNEVVNRELKVDMAQVIGGGAAGGVGAALSVMLDGKIHKGAEYIADYSGLFDAMAEVDLVITGEGKIDRSTLNGKLPYIISEATKRFDKRLILCCGVAENVVKEDFSAEAIISLVDENIEPDYALSHAKELLIKRLVDYLG